MALYIFQRLPYIEGTQGDDVMPATETLRFTAVGHYDVKGVGPCVAKVVAAFIDDASAIAFIKQVNDAQGADELELYVDGIPATEQHERAKAAVILYPAHRNDELHIRALKVLGEKVAVSAWGQVAVVARILDLTAGPVVDHEEDVDQICEDLVLRNAAIAIVLGQPY